MSTRRASADRWRKIIRQQQASGLSALAFCRRVGVPQSSFFAWRKKLRGEMTFAEVKVASKGDVATETAADAGGIELRLPGDRCVVVWPGFDRRTLIELLAALEMSPEEMTTEARA